jgi:beta-glucosidase
MKNLKNKNGFKYPFQNPELALKKRVADLVSRLTVNEKISMLASTQQAVKRLGIAEARFGTEVARGYVSREPGEISTVFPQPIGLASTFNPGLMYELGEICAIETRIYHKKADFTKLMVWGPTVDLCRDPRWGRNEESYGEDPFLTGEMSTAYCLGMVGSDKKYLRVLAGLKHFCCNNHEEDRLRDDANITVRLLREYYYAAFEPAIRRGGAHSLMTAYNELSGVPAMINNDIKKVCKDEWGMLFAVTDGGDFSQNVWAHKYSDSHAQTIALAFKAGNNIMTDITATSIAGAKQAVKSGLVSEKELDTVVSQVMQGRFMLGEFDPPELNPYNDIPDTMLDCDEFRAVNARAAHECITLLKNDNLLPIAECADHGAPLKIAVVGHLANHGYKDWYTGMSSYNVTILQGLKNIFGENVGFHDGCDIVAIKSVLNNRYLCVKNDGCVTADSDKITKACRFKKIDWDGQVIYISEQNGKLLRLYEDDVKSPLNQSHTGYVNALGNDTYEWFGRMIIRPDEYENSTVYKSWRHKDLAVVDNRLCEVEPGAITKAKMFNEEVVVDGAMQSAKLAETADYVIVCAGNDPMVPARECFDRKSLNLPGQQQRLIDEVMKVNRNCILTITASYPYIIPQNLPAVIYTAHAGPQSGNAMADVLTGRYNPAGRLPQTWYKSERDLPDIKDYDIMSSGSTYLYFEGEELYPFGHGLSYCEFEYSDFSVKDTGKNIEVSVKVKNTSDIYGQEVVQLYFTALQPRVKRPKKQLCEFIRQGIEPGQRVEITLVFDKSRLRYWDVTRHKFAVETGEYRFGIGASSKDIRCFADVRVKGEKIPPRDLSKTAAAIDFDDRRGVKLRYDPKCERHYIHAPMWNGALDFYDVVLSGITEVEVTASIDVNEGKIGVFVDDVPVGEITVPAAACPTQFKKHKCKFDKPLKGKGRLTLKLTQYINLMDVKLT